MDLLCADDSHFPDASIVLQLNKAVEEIAGAGNPVSVDTVLKYVKDQSNISDFGLHFMMDVKKDLVLSQEVIDVVFKTVTKICVEQPKAMLEIPAKPDGAEGDAEEEYNTKVDEIKADNEKFTKENAQLTKIKAKVVLKHKPESMQNDNEMALLKINNFTNEVLDVDGKPIKSARTDGSNPEGQAEGNLEVDTFNPEKLPLKIPLVRPTTAGEPPVAIIPYHSEAPYFLRKHIIEQAKKTFKELEKADTNNLLIHSHQRARQLEDRFEELFIKQYGYGKGCQYNDLNTRITFKTFLME